VSAYIEGAGYGIQLELRCVYEQGFFFPLEIKKMNIFEQYSDIILVVYIFISPIFSRYTLSAGGWDFFIGAQNPCQRSWFHVIKMLHYF
jgi:hypothetical protein